MAAANLPAPTHAPLALPRGPRTAAWTSVAFSAVLVIACIVFADSSRVLEHLQRVDSRWLVVFFAISLVQLGLLGLRWSRIAAALGLRLSWFTATTEYALSILLNQVLPTGIAGDGLRALRQGKRSEEYRFLQVLEALALDRASGQLGLWVVVLLSAPLALRAGVVSPGGLATATVLMVGVLLMVWVIVTRITRWEAPAGRALAWCRRASALLLAPRRAAAHLPLSMLLVGAMLLELYVAARAIGVVLPWSQLLWLGPFILVAASVPSFFGGWGIREGASAVLFASAGLPPSTGVAVSMTFGVLTLVVSLPGIIVLFFDADRTRAADSTPWHDAHALSVCVGAFLALWAHYLPVLALVSALCFVILVARSWGSWTPGGGFGAPNMVTSLRLLMTLGLLMGYGRQPNSTLAACALLVLLLDVLDGWLARRLCQSSEFGARFDVEADALLVLTLSTILFTAGIAGPWVLVAGLWRYIYVLAPVVAPTPRGEATRSRLGRLLYVLMIGCFVGALITPAGLAVELAAIGTLAVSISFLRSFWQRYAPVGVVPPVASSP